MLTAQNPVPNVSRPDKKSETGAPKWHLIYYAMAGFDLVAISFSLFINHQITDLYVDSVNINKDWAGRLAQYSKLTELATEVNRPGNDIFLTFDLVAETEKFHRAKADFDTHLASIRISNMVLKQELANRLNVHLQDIEGHMDKLDLSARKILTLFTSSRLLAGNEMARMDRSFFSLAATIEVMSKKVQTLQTDNLFKLGTQFMV